MSRKTELTQEQLDVILDKHEMWVRDPLDFPSSTHKAYLVEVDLSYLCVYDRDLRGISIRHSDLEGVTIVNCNLEGANIMSVQAPKAYFANLNLQGSKFHGSDLYGARFIKSNLSDSDLPRVNLYEARFHDCSIIGVDFEGSNLKDTYIRYSSLNGSMLRNVEINQETSISCTSVAHVRGLDIYSVSNIGSYNGDAIYIPKIDKVFAGCWVGSLDGFLHKGREMNEDNPDKAKGVELAYEFFKHHKIK